MLTLGIETIVVLLLIMGAVCAIGGYAFAQERQRRAGGGKTAQELKTELGDYKENVTEHFQTTANLLHDMTEQYRAVYEHMANGAQKLCDTDSATAQIEGFRAGLLPGVESSLPPGEDPEPSPEQDGADDLEAALESLADELETAPGLVAEPESATAGGAEGGSTDEREPEPMTESLESAATENAQAEEEQVPEQTRAGNVS